MNKKYWLLLGVAFTCTLISCSRVKKIEMVLPDGFKGVIQFVEDRDAESEIVKRAGKFHLKVPDGGKIFVRSVGPFVEGWFLPVPRYEDGTELTVKSPRDANAEGFGFWLINHPTNRVRAFFVGSREDLESIDYSSIHGFDPVRKELPKLSDEEWKNRFGKTE